MAYGENPMNAFVQLVMQGQAKAKGQAAAKDLLEKQTEDAAKSEVTFKGDGSVVLKGAADQLLSNATPDRQVEDAYDEPVKAVAAKLGKRPVQRDPQPELTALQGQLESFGVTPQSRRRAGAEDVDTYREGYGASRELGANPLAAAVDGLRAWAGRRVGTQFGAVAPGAIAEQLNRQRVAQDAGFYMKFIAPTKGAMANERERNEPDRIRPTNFSTIVRGLDLEEYNTAEEFLQALPGLGMTKEMLPGGWQGIFTSAKRRQTTQTDAQREKIRKETLGMYMDKVEIGALDSWDRVKMRMDQATNVTWRPEDYEMMQLEYEKKRKDWLNRDAERKRAEDRYLRSQQPAPDRPNGQWSDEDLLTSDDPKAKKLLNSRAQGIDEQIASAERKIVSLDARARKYQTQFETESKKKGWSDSTEADGYRLSARQMEAEREALANHIADLRARKARLKPSAAAPEIGPPAPGQAPPPAAPPKKWTRLN